MKRVFLSFFLFVVISISVIQFILGPAIETLIESHTEESRDVYYRELVRGVYFVVLENLLSLPPGRRESFIRDLQAEFGYPISVQDHRAIHLTQEERQSFLAGEIIVRGDGDFFYRRIGDSDTVLVMGPFAELDSSIRPPRIEVYIWVAVMVTISFLSFIWALPFWGRLRKISMAAVAFGNGELDRRADVPSHSALAPLANAFNQMANRIQQLITSHKELTHAVSHELRTPIARLRFGVEMLETTVDGAESSPYLSGIQSDIDELENLVTELLTYARMDRETPDLTPEDQPLVPWLEETMEILLPEASSVTLSCVSETVGREFCARFDSRFMTRALRNLVHNALRYAKSRVNVIFECDGADCTLHVDDDGPGIPEKDRERVFDPFVRLDASRSRSSGGYGLGLAIVRRIASRHGGRIEVCASPLGGARFTVRWPGCDPS